MQLNAHIEQGIVAEWMAVAPELLRKGISAQKNFETNRQSYQSGRKAPVLQGGDIRPAKAGSFVAQRIAG